MAEGNTKGGSSIKNSGTVKVGSTQTENRSGSNSARVAGMTGPRAASGGNVSKAS